MKYILFILLLSNFVVAECDNNQIDINSADVDELDSLIWVGVITAERIIVKRPFDSLKDLNKVRGIGEVKVQDIIDENIACVDEKNVIEKNIDEKNIDEKNIDEKNIDEKNTKKEIEKIVLEKPVIKIISLNENKVLEKTIYESKNSLIFKYLPYAFSLFLILIIVLLIYGKQ